MRSLIFILACFCCLTGTSQLLDLAKIENSHITGTEANFQYNRFRTLFNIPFKLTDKSYFLAGFDYSDIQFEFRKTNDSYEKSDAERFRSLDLNLTYTIKMEKNWIFGAQFTPSFISNLEGPLIREDMRYKGMILFLKDMKSVEGVKKPYRIFLGLFYNSISRFPAPIPFIAYYRKFHPKWSYRVGLPYSNLQFHAAHNHRFKIHANADSFNASIQDGLIVNGEEEANRIRMMLIMAGFRYEYKFSKHIESFINITRTFNSTIQLRNGKENVLEENLDGVMHYRMGIRCKI